MGRNYMDKDAMDMTQEEMVKAYTTGDLKIGTGPEVEEYLKTKWRYMHKEATWAEVCKAYAKTNLNKKTT